MVYSSIFINMNSAESKKISFFNDNEDFDSFAFNDVERMQAEAHQTANIISLATFLDKKI